MLLIVFTNWLWIPIILAYDVRLRRAMTSGAPAVGGQPRDQVGAGAH